MSHNMVFSCVSLGFCINLHCATLPFSPLVLSDRAHLKQVDVQRKSAFGIKNNTDRRAEIVSFFFLSLFFFGFNLSWVYSFETDWANVQTKLLISATNVQRCNVEDGQTRWFIRSVFNDCLAPLASVSLQGEMMRKRLVSVELCRQNSIWKLCSFLSFKIKLLYVMTVNVQYCVHMQSNNEAFWTMCLCVRGFYERKTW